MIGSHERLTTEQKEQIDTMRHLGVSGIAKKLRLTREYVLDYIRFRNQQGQQ